MAGDWIKMRTGLRRHPKVVALVSALKTDKLRIVGGLYAVWSVFDEHAVDGKLDGYTPQAMDEEIGFPGFSDAMIAIEWLSFNGKFLEIPRPDEHNGMSAKRRCQDSERKRNVRSLSALGADEDGTKSGPEKRREEKRRVGTRKERGIPPSPAVPGDQGRKGKSAKKPPPITQTDLAIEAYNRILGKTKARPEGLPRAMRINMPAKQEMVRKCSDIAREMCQELYGSPQVTAEFWEEYFGTVSRDPFKSGRQKPGPGHEGWVPDFEYLLKRRTMMQVFERSGAADEPE